mmetsp:Transcript_58762/g.140046  ORF Transcript_58762/g.140046 Transcript_58762/m.140046 type:complete len:324 (+) Transcript_58762:62-1033(+)
MTVELKCALAALSGAIVGALLTLSWLRRSDAPERPIGTGEKKSLTHHAAWLQIDEAVDRPRIVLVAAGSVATVKVPELAVCLAEFADVAVIFTRAAMMMFNQACAGYSAEMLEKFCALEKEGRLHTLTDEDEWVGYASVGGDVVVHVELTKWADLTIIAPCTANTLAKMAGGFCDNLAMSLVRASDPGKPLLVAPAMNTNMWEHPCTEDHLNVLRDRGYRIIPTVQKRLACGDYGYGALAAVPDIVEAAREAIEGFEARRRRDAVGAWRDHAAAVAQRHAGCELSPRRPGSDLSSPRRPGSDFSSPRRSGGELSPRKAGSIPL